MADADQALARLREFGSYLGTSITCLKGLWAEAINVETKQDNATLRTSHFADSRRAVIGAKELLNGELRRVIPEDAVGSVKSWCLAAERTFDHADKAVRVLAGAGPRILNPHPSTFTPDEREFGPEWEVSSLKGRLTVSEISDGAHTAKLLYDLNELASDVDNFKRVILKTPKQATEAADGGNGKAPTKKQKSHAQTSPTVANKTPRRKLLPQDVLILVSLSSLEESSNADWFSSTKIAEKMNPPRTGADIKDGLKRLRDGEYVKSLTHGNQGGYRLTADGRKKLPNAKAKRKLQ